MANQPKKYKKFVATAATATLVASAIVPVASAASLSDIAGNTHEEAINALVDAKVISGYPDGTFKPNKTLTRSDVVKLLGKYLETEGYAPAADYATSPAFNDLKAGSNDELLKYASIVKEAGVFAGSNGNLLAGDKITRENMAITLVRMINTLKDVSLEEYVAAQDFKGDVKDLNVAKAEARSAIAVLDFYDITNPSVSNFNPKGDTTRGQFATFLHKTINADFAGASATTGTVKAINNTTVEVTFGKEIDDIKALKFAIEGLEVKDAVVKQTDKKTAIITTSAQEAGKEYTVTEGGNKIGKFTGISAVIPTGVDFEAYAEASKQGVIGKEVTLKATVKVAEGQSKAGIPVTFNIVNNQNTNEKKEVEVKTDENGVATYTYTRYYEGIDSVVAYATQKSSVYADAKVYWAKDVQLSVTELTTGNELANETKKAYKVNGAPGTTYYVTFKENHGITPDKINTKLKVTTTNNDTLSAEEKLAGATTPYELVTGAVKVATVTTNANGEGTFTVYGSNGSVTPVVFESKDGAKYNKLDLQTIAPTVKFAAVENLEVAIKAEGVQAAAQVRAGVTVVGASYDTLNIGGREYTVTVKDKTGKLAPEGSTVQVSLEATAGNTYFAPAGGKFVLIKSTEVDANKKPLVDNSVQTLIVGKNGEVKFRVAGSGDKAYVKPTAFLDRDGDKVVDTSEVQATAELTYFTAPKVFSAEITAFSNGVPVKSVSAGQTVTFVYQSVDQNGFDYVPTTTTPTTTTQYWVPQFDANGNVVGWNPVNQVVQGQEVSSNYTAVFDVKTTFGDITVDGKPLVKDSTQTYLKTTTNGRAEIVVESAYETTVTVNVSGANNILPIQPASVEFLNSKVVADNHVGIVDSLVNGVLTFKGKNPVTAVAPGTKYFFQNNSTSTTELTYGEFSSLVTSALGSVVVNRVVTKEGTTYTITSITLGGTTNPITALVTAANNKVAEIPAAITAENKTVAQAKVDAAKAAIATAKVAGATDAQLADAQAKVTAAEEAIKALEVGITITSATAVADETFLGALLGNFDYTVAGTGAKATDTELELDVTLVDDSKATVKATVTVAADGSFTATFSDADLEGKVKSLQIKGSTEAEVEVK